MITIPLPATLEERRGAVGAERVLACVPSKAPRISVPPLTSMSGWLPAKCPR